MSHARLAAIVNASSDPIIGETLDGIITDWNPAAERVYGYTASEILGQSLAALAPPDRTHEYVDLLKRVRRGESVEAFDTVRRTKSGTLIDVSLIISPIHNEAGEVVAACAITRDVSARKAAEAELTATHHHTREVLERISDGFFAFDLDWRFTYLNEAAERTLGRSRGELLGKNLWEEFPETIETPIYAAYHRTLAEGINTSAEFHYPPLNAWFEVKAYPSSEGISVFFRNVTASRQLERELRDSEAKYRTLVDHLPAAVYVLAADPKQTALYFSPYFETLTGFLPEEALSRPSHWHWIETIHPNDRERVAREDERTVAAGLPFRMEYRYVRKDGSYVWVLDQCVPVHDEYGSIVAWQGVLLDITDRIQAEEAQARLAAIVEGAEDAIISRTLDGTITSWNRGAERLYGYSAGEAIGQSFTILLPYDEDWSSVADVENFAALATQFEARRQRKDGTIVDVSIAMSPIRDANGVIIGASTVTRDISLRKQLEQQLRAALEAAQAGIRTKSLFLAMMSHELRTPLQAVLGYADLLLLGSETRLATEQIEDIGFIRTGALRMIALIDQMLDLSRMEAGRLQLADEPVDLGAIIEEVRQDVAPQVAAKTLDLSINVPASLPLVRGDSNRLRQILLNLVGNAVKFTETGSVRITGRATAAGVDIDIVDTGIGIAVDALPFVFEEFRQVDGNLTRRYGGAGLGLAIAKKLAEQMGGDITVESESGIGSTFTLHLVASGDQPAHRGIRSEAGTRDKATIG